MRRGKRSAFRRQSRFGFWARKDRRRKSAVRTARAVEVLEDRRLLTFDTPILNFDGQGFANLNPPDTVGDVGLDYYVQAINGLGGSSVTIYNKSDGSLAMGPFDMDTLATGGGLESNGSGDPIVLYDHLADRWVLTEFTGPGADNGLSVFISQTSDPTAGTWDSFHFPTTNFPDYPKYAVWPDGYYVSTNEPGASPVYVMDRTSMLAGTAPGPIQRLTAPALAGFGFQGLTPADLDGPAPPPGTPGIFMRHRDDEVHNVGSNDTTQDFLEVWEFDAAANTFTQSDTIGISEFDSDLNGLTAFNAFPQPGTTTQLDPLREVIMHRLVYRNFGTHEALLGNFVTDVDGTDHGGIRWFELRRVGTGTWTLHQEGTQAPDAVNRWMGAIAMDGSGNIALGYNVTDATSTFPGIRYAGRQSSDPLGTLPQGEFVLVDGTGSITSNRWGDYSSMNVDPVDDSTFWFTGEYGLASGNWATRIGSFKFEGVAPPSALSTATTTVSESQTLPVRVTLTRSGTPEELAEELEVFLASNDTSEITLDIASIIIPANQTFVEFDATIVADDVLDGDQIATITATLPNPDTDPDADPFIEIGTLDITVLDHETLSVSIVDSAGDAVTSVSESGGPAVAEAIISRSNTSVTIAPNILVSQSDRVLEYTSYGQLIDEFDVEFGGVSRQGNASHRLFGVASLNGADTILEFDPQDGSELNRFDAPNASGMAFTGDRLFYLIRTNANRLVEADPDTGRVIKNHQIPSGALHDGVAHLNGNLYLLDSLAAQISVFDPETGEFLNTFDLATINADFPALSGDITGITGPDGLILTTASTNELIELDPSTGEIRMRGTHVERDPIIGSAAVGGNIFLGSAASNSVGVYDRTAVLLRRENLAIPSGVRSLAGDNTGPVTEKARDLVVLDDGTVAIYDGTFEVHAEFRDTAGSFGTPLTLPQFSTEDVAGYGGIAWNGSNVYLTDMVTNITDRTKGIVQISGSTAELFDSAFNFTDLAMGVNTADEPRLFALASDTQTVVVFDPADLETPIENISLDHPVRSIAVNSTGQIYGGGLDGILYSFDETGVETGSLAPDAGLLIDLDFAADREPDTDISLSETYAFLVVGTDNGQVLITDESLGSFTAFDVGDGQSPVYVSLASSVALDSEPELLPELVVELSGDDSEVVLPASVVIPAGETSVTIELDAQDDFLLDGTQIVAITPSADGYVIVPAELQVTDQEELTFTIENTSLAEGGRTIATISRSNIEGPFNFRDNHSVASNDPRLPIAIRDQETIESVFEVSGVPSAEILDLNVTVNLQHSWTADLEITLISPDIVAPDGSVSNRRVTLVTDNGTNGKNLTATVFDDEGLRSIVTGNAPFTGQFRPQGKLSDLDGLKPNGTWTLQISDDNIQNQGQLLGWSLDFLVNGLEPLEVTISSDDDPNSQELILPTTVVLPANQQTISFEIEALNDFFLDAVQTVEVVASAPEYMDDTGAVVQAVNEIQVLDVDAPVVLAPIGDVAPDNVVVMWNAVLPEDDTSTVTYNVHVQLVATGADVRTDTGIIGTEFDLSLLLPRDSYRVRVGAVVGSSEPSWSEFVSFANSIAPTAPTVFTSAQAIGDRVAQTSDRTPTVFWNKTGDAVQYLVTLETIHGVPDETLPQAERDMLVDGDGEKDEVATFTVASTVLGPIDPANPQYESLGLSALELGSYRIKVASQDSLGRWSPESSYFFFDVIEDVLPPMRPSVVSPDAIITDDTPVVRWEMPGRADGGDPLEGIDHFTVAIVTGDRSRTVFYERTVRRTSLLIQTITDDGSGGQIIQGLPVNEDYKVFINAYNSEGEHRWSAAHDFQIVTGIPTPSAPIIAEPSTFVQPSNVVTVTWSPVENGLTYDIWANNRTTGDRQVIRAFNFRETSHTSDPLPPGIYAVYVRAFNATLQPGPWSAPKFFQVAANLEAKPDQQVQDSPESGATPSAQEVIETPQVLLASFQEDEPVVTQTATYVEVAENLLEAAQPAVDTDLDLSFDKVMQDLSESDWLIADAPIEGSEAILESEDITPRAAGFGLVALVPVVGHRISRAIGRLRRRFSGR